MQKGEIGRELEQPRGAILGRAVVEAAHRPLGDLADQHGEHQRRQGDDPDPRQAIEQIVAARRRVERGAANEPAGDQHAAEHEKPDHRLVAEPGDEEEGPHRGGFGAGDIAAVGADGVQPGMMEQDQEHRQPAQVVEDRREARTGPPTSARGALAAGCRALSRHDRSA